MIQPKTPHWVSYPLFSVVSPSWTSRCPTCLLPALRPWPPWSESSECSWAWRCSAWTWSSTSRRTPSPSSTSTSSPVMLLHTRTQMQTWPCSHRHPSLSLSGYEGVPQFFSALLSHIESVLEKQTSAGPQAVGPSATSAGLWDTPGTVCVLHFTGFLEQIEPLAPFFSCFFHWEQTRLFSKLYFRYELFAVNLFHTLTWSEAESPVNNTNNDVV